MVNVDAIMKKIEEQINNASVKEKFSKKWEILEIKDGVAIVNGLEDAMFSEIVEFENGVKWLILDLLQESVWVLILWNTKWITQWQVVRWTGSIFSIAVGDEFLWRVVNGIWEPIDWGSKIKSKDMYPVEKIAPWVIERKSVDQPLQTGIKVIDTLVPIGRWQRELIIWDRQTGKTTIALDTILNQKNEDIFCIYVAIGQKESKVKRFVQTLRENWVLDKTIVVSAPISSPSVLQYLAPYVWCAFGEYFMNNGKDAVIFYDDLSKHAVAYREISLLLRRPPGREAYPGDVFYLHSRLLERSARLWADYWGGSLTALPIIETQAWDIGAYIPTNVISITDGQIFLDSDLFNSGIRPAMNVGTSVSRVWGAAQTKIIKKVSWSMKLELANFRELESFAQFSSDLDKDTLRVIEKWKRITEILKQPENKTLPFEKQAVIMYLIGKWYLDDIDLGNIRKFENEVYDKLDSTYKPLADSIRNEKTLTESIENDIKKLWTEIQDIFVEVE